MGAGGLVLVVLGIFVVVQIVKGDALGRLGLA